MPEIQSVGTLTGGGHGHEVALDKVELFLIYIVTLIFEVHFPPYLNISFR